MIFTKEQLIARISQVTAINKFRIKRDPDADGLAMDNELLAIALAALAGMEAEPAHEATDWQVAECVARMEAEGDMVLVPRGLVGAALGAIGHPKHEAGITMGSLRHYAYKSKISAPQPATVVPETLPCPVVLEPGLRFGKGVRTQTMLNALQRRAEYHAELEAMTPEQRADHDAGVKEFAAMLQANHSGDADEKAKADGTLTNEGTIPAEPVSNRDELPSREHFESLCCQFWNWRELDSINDGEEEPRLEWDGNEFTHRVTQALWRMYQAAAPRPEVAQAAPKEVG